MNKPNKKTNIVFKGHTFQAKLPLAALGIPGPMHLNIKYRPTVKLSGSVSTAIGLKGNNIIKFKSTSSQDEVIDSDSKTDLGWGNDF